MGKPNILLSISLCLFVLFHGCLARQDKEQRSECQLDRLTARNPDNRFEFEAGSTESWDPFHDEFQCAGVAVFKRTIKPNGLLLPSYSNAPQLIYIVRGRGVTGVLFPGCPETFEESQNQGRKFQDQHQRIQRFREGDVLAFPAGTAHWCYNDGKEPVVAVSLLDTTNSQNQLDFNPRHFFLAGQPEDEFQQEGRRQPRRGEEFRRPGKKGTCNNVFYGFDTRFLAEAFNVDERLAKKLRSENDYRGNIVKARDGLQTVRPPSLREEEQEFWPRRGGERNSTNGFEETFCTMRFRENIGDPSRADVFTPEAGRLSSLNSLKLPVLRSLQLSAERGVLYNDAMMLPHWNLNAHSVIYASRGEARFQVVDHSGQTVFDGEMREGQVLVVPQNFAVLKRAEKERFEWVAFKTNDNAMFSPFAGRTSAIRALPAEVLANAFRISVEEAKRIKFGQQETTLSSRRSTQSGRRDVA